MKRIIFVVSRNHLDLVPGLERGSNTENVEIIVDRRWNERREALEPIPFPDHRRSERRFRSTSRELDLIGIAVAVVP